MMNICNLSNEAVNRLSNMLDNPTCGWRQLANAAAEQLQFRCSEKELTSCSLQVLNQAGSPARALLALLADRSCSLDFLLLCLRKMEHQEAVNFLSSTVSGQIRISMQPQAQQAPPGSRVVLVCRALGPPTLSYQWFKGKEEVVGETGSSPELVLWPLSPAHQGHYICRINHRERFTFSRWAHVGLLQPARSSPGSMFPGSAGGLRIVQQPQSQTASEGDELVLRCRAEADPPAQFEWYHNDTALTQQKGCTLTFPCVTTEHRGRYRCKVFNLYHESWSESADVAIGPSLVTDAAWAEVDRGLESEEVQSPLSTSGAEPFHEMASPSPAAKTFYATDKVALLIGNMHYVHHQRLSAPISDVHELSNLLRQLDFKVVSLLDLSWQEMHSAVTEFLLLLDKGVYGLLYFAGHGHENYGNSFMVPIDAPASYTSEHCLCVQKILTRMQEKQTGLNVFLLDMCRNRNPHDDVIVQPKQLKVTANIVFGYATCADAKAYEVRREDVSNGIFINFLKRHVCKDEKVTVMLDRVAEDMGRCAITRGRQALELRSNLSERRSLTDKIQTPERSASASARNLQWAVANVLPERRFLQFDCGVKVQLGFAAEFSNVLVIYTRILEKPEEIASCYAQLTDFPEDVAVDLKKSNQETLIEAGSLMLIKERIPRSEVTSLYTRVCSLQRLGRELTFTVCLLHTYTNMDEEVEERLQVCVGKPLVSKLNLHEARAPGGHSGPGLDSFSCTSGPPGEVASVDSAPCSRWDPVTLARSANVPEETEGPTEFGAPQPLSATKSLPFAPANDAIYKFAENFHSF